MRQCAASTRTNYRQFSTTFTESRDAPAAFSTPVDDFGVTLAGLYIGVGYHGLVYMRDGNARIRPVLQACCHDDLVPIGAPKRYQVAQQISALPEIVEVMGSDDNLRHAHNIRKRMGAAAKILRWPAALTGQFFLCPQSHVEDYHV